MKAMIKMNYQMTFLLVRSKLLLFILFLGFTHLLVAKNECIPEPRRGKLVNDYADVLDQREESSLEQQLRDFNDTTSTQIAVVTLSDLCGYDIAQLAIEIGEEWGVGNAKFDNGVVILVKPKIGNSKGQAFIASGYGLEGVLPDLTLNHIVDLEMIPFFKKEDYYGGFKAATNRIIEIAGGEYSAEDYNKKAKGKTKAFPVFFIIAILFFIFASTVGRARRYAHQNNIGLWTALWLMGSSSRRHGGYYNNFSSGSGSFGGFGGGSGFGGFGGGSFGGGGAGGSW